MQTVRSPESKPDQCDLMSSSSVIIDTDSIAKLEQLFDWNSLFLTLI